MAHNGIEIVTKHDKSESVLLLDVDKGDERGSCKGETSSIKKQLVDSTEVVKLSNNLLQYSKIEMDRLAARKIVMIFASVALFFTSAPCLIMLNKYLLKDKNFKFPMILSGIGLLSSTVVTQSLRLGGLLVLEQPVTRNMYMKRIFPIGLFMALTLNFGNRAYLYLSVSLIQMLKAGTPAITLFIVWVTGLSNPSLKLALAVFVMSLGVAVSSVTSDESTWSLFGFFVMFLSEIFEAIRCALLQYMLAGLNFGALEALTYFAPTALIWMIGLIMFHELPQFLDVEAILTVYDNLHLFALCFILGFLVNVAGFFVMKSTSVVTLKILAQVRNVGLILVNVVFWHEIVTVLQTWGYLVTLLGFAWYQYESIVILK